MRGFFMTNLGFEPVRIRLLFLLKNKCENLLQILTFSSPQKYKSINGLFAYVMYV